MCSPSPNRQRATPERSRLVLRLRKRQARLANRRPCTQPAHLVRPDGQTTRSAHTAWQLQCTLALARREDRRGKSRGLSAITTADIWLIDLQRGAQIRLTTDPASDTYAAWSPGGDRIAFVSTRELTSIYQKPLSGVGTEEVLLTSEGMKVTPDWSPDRRFILLRTIKSDDECGFVFAAPLGRAKAGAVSANQVHRSTGSLLPRRALGRLCLERDRPV